MKSLHKLTQGKRYLLRKQTKVDWISSRFWISRLLALLIQQGKKHFILNAYYNSLFILKLDTSEDILELFIPLYALLEASVPLIGFTRVRGKRRRRVLNPQWRPRIERPLRCYNLAFRWIRNLLKTVTTRYIFERFIVITETFLGPHQNTVLIQKFKHYELAIRFMNYLRVRRLHRKRKKIMKAPNNFAIYLNT